MSTFGSRLRAREPATLPACGGGIHVWHPAESARCRCGRRETRDVSVRTAWRGKPAAYVLGTVRYWQTMGQGYAEMFKGSLTAGGIVTAGAAWLGIGKAGAILLGVGSVVFWQALAVLFGWLAWRHKIIEETLDKDWRNDPAKRRTIEALEKIEAHLARRAPGGTA